MEDDDSQAVSNGKADEGKDNGDMEVIDNRIFYDSIHENDLTADCMEFEDRILQLLREDIDEDKSNFQYIPTASTQNLYQMQAPLKIEVEKTENDIDYTPF